MKRTLVLLLVAVLLSSTTACSEKTPTDETPNTAIADTVPEETDSVLEEDNLPDRDFGGDTFDMTICVTTHWDSSYHIMEELTGEGLNDARYYNIMNTENRFNVDITETDTGDDVYVNDIIAGSTSQKVSFRIDSVTLGAVNKGVIHDLNQVPVIDLDRVYWNQAYQDVASINNKLFFTIGAFDTAYIERSHALLFNKSLAEQYHIEDPYELVRSGKWTVDKMTSTMQDVTTDLNGDGIYNTEDRWGYLCVAKQVLPNFWIGAGFETIGKDENGILQYTLDTDEPFHTFIDKMYQIMWDGQHWCFDTAVEDISPVALDMFDAGRGLYVDINFYLLQSMRDREVDFGVLPYPKVDETQNRYYTRVEAAHKVVSIPVTIVGDDLEMTGTILEALYCDAQNTIIPEFIEVMLKGKTARDAESQETMEIILENMVFDYGDTWWNHLLRDGFFYPMFCDNNRNIISGLVERRNVIEEALNTVLPSYGVAVD